MTEASSRHRWLWPLIALLGGVLWACCFGRGGLLLAPWGALVPLFPLLGGRRPALLTWIHGTAFWTVGLYWIPATLASFGGIPGPLSVARSVAPRRLPESALLGAVRLVRQRPVAGGWVAGALRPAGAVGRPRVAAGVPLQRLSVECRGLRGGRGAGCTAPVGVDRSLRRERPRAPRQRRRGVVAAQWEGPDLGGDRGGGRPRCSPSERCRHRSRPAPRERASSGCSSPTSPTWFATSRRRWIGTTGGCEAWRVRRVASPHCWCCRRAASGPTSTTAIRSSPRTSTRSPTTGLPAARQLDHSPGGGTAVPQLGAAGRSGRADRSLRQAPAGAVRRVRPVQGGPAVPRQARPSGRRLRPRRRPGAAGVAGSSDRRRRLLRSHLPDPRRRTGRRRRHGPRDRGQRRLVRRHLGAVAAPEGSPVPGRREPQDPAARRHHGVSVVVGPDGEVEQQLGVGEEGTLRVAVAPATDLTPYSRLPWGPPAVMSLLAMIAWLSRSGSFPRPFAGRRDAR